MKGLVRLARFTRGGSDRAKLRAKSMMMAFMFLPRQFHIMVIENSSERHIRSAMWKFPFYLFAINLFVIPIALGGIILNGGDVSQAQVCLRQQLPGALFPEFPFDLLEAGALGGQGPPQGCR